MSKPIKERESSNINDYHDMLVYVYPSLMCNMRHNFCYQTSYAKTRLPDQILYEKLKPLYPYIKNMILVGGEVTFIPGMKEYIRFLGENYPNLTINIVTNGLKFDEEWIELSRKYNLISTWSLDATNESATQKILVKGNGKYYWDRIYGNFLKLVEAHEKHHTSLINAISMVVNDDTINEIVPFTKLALKHGVNAKFQYPCGEGEVISQQLLESIYTVQKMKFFCKDFIDIRIMNLPLLMQIPSILESFENEDVMNEKGQFLQSIDNGPKKTRNKTDISYESIGSNLKAMRCDMPWKGLVIMPSGDILPCCNMSNYILGNIYYQSIEEILNSVNVNKLRELIENNDYRFCYKRCNLNFNPNSNILGAVSDYTPAYKKAFNEGNYKKVIEELKSNPNLEYLGPEAIYHLAFSLHMEGRKEEALKYYDLALEKGMEEFWVRYNRGSLYLDMGEYEKSYADLSRAIELNPDHEGVKTVMGQLGAFKIERS